MKPELPREEEEWIAAAAAREERLGPIVPEGAQGGLGPRAGGDLARGPIVVMRAAYRARERVRAAFRVGGASKAA
jgi:hypothetical protein